MKKKKIFNYPLKFYYSEKIFLLQKLYKFFIQYILKKGKKYKIENMFNKILFYIIKYYKEKFNFKNILNSIKNTTPTISVKTKRKGSKNIYVPIKITKNRAQFLSYNWIVSSAKSKSNVKFYLNFIEELIESSNKKSLSVKKCNNLHDLAENSVVYLKGKLK